MSIRYALYHVPEGDDPVAFLEMENCLDDYMEPDDYANELVRELKAKLESRLPGFYLVRFETEYVWDSNDGWEYDNGYWYEDVASYRVFRVPYLFGFLLIHWRTGRRIERAHEGGVRNINMCGAFDGDIFSEPGKRTSDLHMVASMLRAISKKWKRENDPH